MGGPIALSADSPRGGEKGVFLLNQGGVCLTGRRRPKPQPEEAATDGAADAEEKSAAAVKHGSDDSKKRKRKCDVDDEAKRKRKELLILQTLYVVTKSAAKRVMLFEARSLRSGSSAKPPSWQCQMLRICLKRAKRQSLHPNMSATDTC